MTIIARTVLDLRSRQDKFVSQVLLLAAGWHRYCRDHVRLEVLTVGPAQAEVTTFLDELGIVHAGIAPSANDAFSRTSNKIEAAYPDAQGRRVLLLDNDTCFLGSVADLAQLPADAIAAAEPGHLRVTPEQWELMRDALGLPLLRDRFEPVNAPARQPAGAQGEPPERSVYFNSGAVLFPAGHDHRATWLSHQQRIFDFFREHPLASKAVLASDQAAFATSVAAHGAFAWLPLRFNYRYGCFRRGLEPRERIAIVHLTGDLADAHALSLSQRVDAYWTRFILDRMQDLATQLEPAQFQQRQQVAQEVRADLAALVRDYGLDGRLDAFRAARHPATPA
jgi:hypothetical protein